MNAQNYRFRSKQNDIHIGLVKLVKRYAASAFLRPIPDHQSAAFLQIEAFVHRINRPIIIDSGCGTGLSSQKLALAFPDFGIVGIDKSQARLSRAAPLSLTNLLLVHGDLIDLWRLIRLNNIPVIGHFLLFPNPWPKVGHLKRRFYAHPVFKDMIALAPYFELRTNWLIYAEECKVSLQTLGYDPVLSVKTDPHYMTLFEKKYLEAGCPIYVLKNGSGLSPAHAKACAGVVKSPGY